MTNKILKLFLLLAMILPGLLSAREREERQEHKSWEYYDAERVKVIRIHQLTTDGRYGRAKWSPDGEMIAANWSDQETKEEGILFLEFHDSGKKVEKITLLKNAGIAGFDWDSDSERIVYIEEDASLWVAEIDDDGIEDKQKIIPAEVYVTSPKWSPDGEYITFSADDMSIGTVRPDGTDFRIIIERKPNEVPDEAKFISENEIVYTKGGEIEKIKTGMGIISGEEYSLKYTIFDTPLYTYNLRTHEERKIVSESVNKYICTYPYYEKKDKKNKNLKKIYYDLWNEKDTFIIDSNGTNKVKIFERYQNTVQTSRGIKYDYLEFANFSPDASKFVAIQGVFEDEALLDEHLFIMNTNGTGKSFLIDKQGNKIKGEDPLWSPEGKWILYSKGGNLFVLKLSRHHDDKKKGKNEVVL